MQFHVARALEFLIDDLIHAAARIDQRSGNDCEAAAIFNTSLVEPETKKEKEKALHDILVSVKRISYEYNSGRLGSDVEAINRVIAGKKALEELSKTHISLD